MLLSVFTLEKCKCCGKIKLVGRKYTKIDWNNEWIYEWKCPSCGNKNEKQLPPPWIA